MRVKELRRRIQVNLETYINQQRPLMRGRFGELLLLLPPLQNIARLMVDLVTRYNQDTKQVDDLINEMLLSKSRSIYQKFRRRRKKNQMKIFSTLLVFSSYFCFTLFFTVLYIHTHKKINKNVYRKKNTILFFDFRSQSNFQIP